MKLCWVALMCVCRHGTGAPFPRRAAQGRESQAPVTETWEQYDKKSADLLDYLDDYEIVTPALVDHNGKTISYDVTSHYHDSRRKKRATLFSIDPDNHEGTRWVYYKLTAYGHDFNFNVTLNKGLLSSGYASEFRGLKAHGARASQARTARHCHYTGRISDSATSRVAISNCFGLLGNFATEADEYFVEPLLPTEGVSVAGGQDHVVYRRSAIRSKHRRTACGVPDNRGFDDFRWMANLVWQQNEIHKTSLEKPVKQRASSRRRRSVSLERHVETLVVADQTMVEHHGPGDVEQYILTLMNIVANIYREASLGNAVNIVVVKVILLAEEQTNLTLTYNADKSLASFCKWQSTINDTDKHGRHDNAVLITRRDICTYKNEPCGTLGLAPVAGMCEPTRSCSITEDIGLASAFTVAHEIGHNFGMQHDGAGNLCGTAGQEGARLMAAELAKTEEPFSWSSCSRRYISDFLDSGRGDCLLNSPQEGKVLELPTKLAGQMHDAHYQCQLQFGPKSIQCATGNECRELWCLQENGKCDSTNIPIADGTMCITKYSLQGWCYHGVCVNETWAPLSSPGGWTPWSGWGGCTRPCGGGVRASQRFCTRPRPRYGGRYCIGERSRYRSCHVQDCPANVTDFRELQCKAYDVVPFRGKYYKWKPYTGRQLNPCALNCLAIGFNFYTERAPKTIDGTRCSPDSRDMCINGKCVDVGCDGILGSKAKENKCRQCEGDASVCRTVQQVSDASFEGHTDSYQEVARIPKGAVHIKVQEVVTSKNYLALRSVAGQYYINGAWTIDWPWEFQVAGTVFHYDRPRAQPESLTALGPITEELVVMVLLQEPNKGVKYQYNIATVTNYSTDQYTWQIKSWTACSRTCGFGSTHAVAVCVLNKETVANDLCDTEDRPQDGARSCQLQLCTPEWLLGQWSNCSTTCGGGWKHRNVSCIRDHGDNRSENLTWDQCPGHSVPTELVCNNQTCPFHWVTDAWSQCSPPCGEGQQFRAVYCVSSEGLFQTESHCPLDARPEEFRLCSLGQCPDAMWVMGEWGECSSRCGSGRQMRHIGCRDFRGEPSNECSLATMPQNARLCVGSCDRRTKTQQGCEDVNKVAYCPLVLKFHFCNRVYFRQMCCRTCQDAGL